MFETTIPNNVEYGDRAVALDGEILSTVVGSGVHGIAIEGTDDHDVMGVYIEPPNYVLGVRNRRDDYIWRSQPEGSRSGPGDVDLVMYSLRKYLQLAIKGNPTALLPLYAPSESIIKMLPLGKGLRSLRDLFLSDEAVKRFLGYMESQHERMLGLGRRSKVPNRPELIDAHGWDVKYGSHALRLAYQGHEIASKGFLTLPLEEGQRQRVLSVKRGEVPRDDVSAEITHLQMTIRELLATGQTAVPARPDIDVIEAWSISAHFEFWRGDVARVD